LKFALIPEEEEEEDMSVFPPENVGYRGPTRYCAVINFNWTVHI